jgi:hypothetical protein
MFVPIKLEFLQRASALNVDLPPCFDSPTHTHTPAKAASWADYCAVVRRNARVHSSSNRTSTVLQAFVEDPSPATTSDYSAYQTSERPPYKIRSTCPIQSQPQAPT